MSYKKSETRLEIHVLNNKVRSHLILIKQEAELARVHLNLSSSKLVLENYFITDLNRGIYLN